MFGVLHMHAGAGGGAQYQTVWKPPFDQNISQPGALRQLEQLIRFKTAQYRQSTIVSEQAVVQNQLAQCRVKEIRDRMTMQIDHEYPTSRDTTHLAEDPDHLLVNEMVRKQRTDHVIKLR